MNSESSVHKSFSSEADITNILLKDQWRMDVLRAAEEFDLPDWWIGAGFLRNMIWNSIEGKESEASTDVDLVYFDENNKQPETDWAYDKLMKDKFPFAEWEIRNQARMHYVNNFDPFVSTQDGISNWVETATCVAVRLNKDRFSYLFCYGTDDLFGLVARPIPKFRNPELIDTFRQRVQEKKWQEKWPNLKVEEL